MSKPKLNWCISSLLISCFTASLILFLSRNWLIICNMMMPELIFNCKFWSGNPGNCICGYVILVDKWVNLLRFECSKSIYEYICFVMLDISIYWISYGHCIIFKVQINIFVWPTLFFINIGDSHSLTHVM